MFYLELLYFDCSSFLSCGPVVFRELTVGNRQIDRDLIPHESVASKNKNYSSAPAQSGLSSTFQQIIVAFHTMQTDCLLSAL